MLRVSTLGLAFLFTAPTMWAAFSGHGVGLDTLIVRFLIAFPVAGTLLGLARAAMQPRAHSRTGAGPHDPDPQ